MRKNVHAKIVRSGHAQALFFIEASFVDDKRNLKNLFKYSFHTHLGNGNDSFKKVHEMVENDLFRRNSKQITE